MLADDVATILKENWHQPATVMGISYGGLVAGRVALLCANLVENVILLASAPSFSPSGQQRVLRQIECLEEGDFEGFLCDFATIFRRRWLNVLLHLRLRLELKKLVANMSHPESSIRFLKAMVEADDVALNEVQTRTLILGDSEDQFFGEGAMQQAAQLIPRAEFEILEGEGDMVPIERARDVTAILARFLIHPTTESAVADVSAT